MENVKQKKVQKRVWPISSDRNSAAYIIFAILVVVLIILTIVLKLSFFDLIVSLTGILYVAILAERNILNFGIGIINVILYIILCWQTKLYGEVIFYFIDLLLVVPAFLDWKRSMKENSSEKLKVESKKLKTFWYIILPFAIAAFTIAYGLLLEMIGGENYFWDALSSGVSFIATLLAWKQFREQWVGWVFVYIVSIILWISAGNILMVVMSAGCLFFSFKGFAEWWRNQKDIEKSKSLRP